MALRSGNSECKTWLDCVKCVQKERRQLSRLIPPVSALEVNRTILEDVRTDRPTHSQRDVLQKSTRLPAVHGDG